MLNILGRSNDHGFDEPLGLLSDCHRRIESFLGILLRVARGDQGRPLGAKHAEAVRKAQAYFAHAAPRHTADEEESLFPRVRAALPAGVGGADAFADLDRLHADHGRADAMHARVDVLLTAWLREGTLPGERATELVTLLESLDHLYREHIRVEEEAVFPLAGKVLSGDELARVGDEMRARRGLKPEP
ncbi:MAG: hemerythrin domain-containing protein [Phycisphaerales bacterium]|nr:hemerythrin domain-containing protein [Phycisphaerales bacterium]